MPLGINNLLSKNYEKRVEKFILDMVEKPIIIREYDKETSNSRHIPIVKSAMRLKKLPNITSTNSLNDYHIKKIQSDSNIKSPSEKSKKKNINTNVIQPFMRFTAKDDISRLCDVLNTDCKTELRKKRQSILIENQSLKNQKKIKETKEEKQKKIKETNEILSEPKHFYPSRNRQYGKMTIKKEIAKELLKEYHIKTHFQAASVFSLQSDHNYNEINDNEVNPLKCSHSQSNSKEKKSFSFIRFNSHHNKHNHFQNKNKLAKKPSNKINISYDNNHDYQNEINLLQNNILSHSEWGINSKKKNDSYPQSSINYLLNLSRRQPATNHKELKDADDFHEKYFNSINDRIKENTQIIIDDVIYNKSNVKDISNCILKKCNYFHQKNKSSITMHNGDGRLMFTNGLSVKDFIMKHSLYSKRKKILLNNMN